MDSSDDVTRRQWQIIGDLTLENADISDELDRRTREVVRLQVLLENFPDPRLLASFFADAVEMIGDRERAARWMLRSIQALGGKTPLDVLADGGEEEVRRVLSVGAF